MGFFEFLGNELDGFFELMNVSVGSEMAEQLSILFSAYLTMTIIIKGYETIMGIAQSPISELIWDFSKKCLIIVFALNYGGYLDFVVDAVNGIHSWAGGGFSVYENLDILGDKAHKLAMLAYDKSSGGFSLGFLIGVFAQVLILIGYFIIATPAFLVLLLTTFTLKIILMLAPVIIACIFFGWLKGIFTQALNILISNILTVMIVSILLNSLSKYIANFIRYADNSIENNVDSIYIGFQFLVFAIVFGNIIKKATDIAKELGVASIESTGKSIARGTSEKTKNVANNTAKATDKAGGLIQSYRNRRKNIGM